jgi:hypothetical protein
MLGFDIIPLSISLRKDLCLEHSAVQKPDLS